MPSDLDLHGVWVPLITPFDTSGSVDIEAIERLCGEYLADGVAGIVALGTTGEAPALDADEKQAVIDACSRVCAERRCTADRRHRHQQHAFHARRDAGARGHSRRRRRARGRAVLRAAVGSRDHRALPRRRRSEPGPVVAYNIPSRTGRGLGAASLLELAPHPQHRRREAGRRARSTATRSSSSPTHPPVSRCLGGDEAFAFPTVVMGGVGAIAAAAHLCTARFVAMVECALAGKLDDGRAHSEALLPMIQAGVLRAESRGLQGCAARAGSHRDARRAHAAVERVGRRGRTLPRRRLERIPLSCSRLVGSR